MKIEGHSYEGHESLEDQGGMQEPLRGIRRTNVRKVRNHWSTLERVVAEYYAYFEFRQTFALPS